jgi:lipopolysaccharide transport system permease protein
MSFTCALVFGMFARFPDETVPYVVFVFCGFGVWQFFTTALTSTAASLTSNTTLIEKVYCPRLILPLSATLARFIELSVWFATLLIMMIWFRIQPRVDAFVVVPIAFASLVLLAYGLGAWLAAPALQYRDVGFALQFVLQLGLYLTPVFYSSRLIPERLARFYALNPLTRVIACIRSSLLQTAPVPWCLLGYSFAISLLVAIGGTYSFRASERFLADVV